MRIKHLKKKDDLIIIFKSCLGNINENNIVFSCGSGVTACVLALAYSLINDKYLPCIYDGSWAEKGHDFIIDRNSVNKSVARHMNVTGG